MRDIWLTRREAIKIDKIKKSLTIPAASYPTFRRHACLEYLLTDNNDNRCATPDFPADEFTLEFWFKALSSANTKQVICIFGDITPQIEVSLLNNNLTVRVWQGGVPAASQTITGQYAYNWTHLAVTFDSTAIIIYINGIAVTVAALAGALDSGSIFFHIAQSSPLTELFVGRIAEIRIWDIARTAAQINSTYDKPRIANGGDITGLVHFYKCNGVTLSGGNEQDQIDTIQAINASSTKFTTEDAPPLNYGASFVAAEISVSNLDYSLSFSFPVIKPENTTGMLVVRWLDEDNVVQRRRFWDLSGVDINPFPAEYNGEAVLENFVLEWWNIDGEETIEVSEDITLRISKTTNPTTANDTTAIEAAAVTVNTDLATALPLTFPLNFNSNQGYN